MLPVVYRRAVGSLNREIPGFLGRDRVTPGGNGAAMDAV
jgi:hypothetical protein